MRTVLFLILGCGILFGQVQVVSRISSPASLGRRLSESDAVVVGTIRSINSAPNQTGILLQIVRNLKGSLLPGEMASVDLAVSSSMGGDRQRETGIWFLQKTSEQKWQALPTMQTSMLFLGDFYLRVDPIEPKSPPANLPDARLFRELANSVEQNGLASPVWSWMERLPTDFADSQSLRAMYSSFLMSTSPEVKALGIAGLVRDGNPAGYDALLADNTPRSQSPSVNGLLNRAVCEGPRKTEFIQALVKLASSDSSDMARCAAGALAALHTAETLPTLARLLDHPSRDVRFQAVAGLASFASNLGVPKGGNDLSWLAPRPGPAPYKPADGNSHYPTTSTFVDHEAEYITFWKDWWSKNQASILAPRRTAF